MGGMGMGIRLSLNSGFSGESGSSAPTSYPNLVLKSQQLNDATWSGGGYTAVANSAANPIDAAVTADTFVEDAASSFKYTAQGIAGLTAAATYTASVYAKKGTHDKIQLIGGFTGADYCNFDLTAGTVGSSAGCTGSIINVGGGWYRCIATGTQTPTTATFALSLISATTDGRTPTYLGSNRTLFVYQMQLLAGSFADGGSGTVTA